MNTEEIIKAIEANADSAQLIKAVIKLIEVAHSCGADDKAARALAECGIELSVGEEV